MGLLARERIHASIALPSSDPLLWRAVGTAEDVLTVSAIALIFLGLRFFGVSSAATKVGYTVVLAVFAAMWVVQSEAVIVFGASLQASVVRGGSIGDTLARSRTVTGLSLLIAAAAILALSGLASRLLRGDAGLRTRILFGCGMASAVVVLLLSRAVHQRETAENPVWSLARIVGASADRGRSAPLERFDQAPDLIALRRMAGATPDRVWRSAGYPLAYDRIDAGDLSFDHPNFVIIAVENLRAADVGAYGSPITGITPNIDRLARAGIRVERAYSAGTYTPAGELALWYGVLPVPGTNVLTAHPTTPLTGLPEILRREGWRSFLWISSTDQTFYGRDHFYPRRGFQMYDGNSFSTSDPRVNWGYSDRVLARRAAQAMGRLEEPFAAMMLTVNNHHPYQLPSDAGAPLPVRAPSEKGFVRLDGTDEVFGRHGSQLMQTVHYSDAAIGDFFRLARDQPWFERTIFVITGDHGVAIAPAGERITSSHRLRELRHRVPLIIYSPMLEGGVTIPGPASQVDVMPTLLGLAGVKEGLTGIGRDLLGEEDDPDRPVFGWSDHDNGLMIVSGDRIFSARLQERDVVDEQLVRDEGGRFVPVDEPATMDRLRVLARAYAESWAPMVLGGRSGEPGGADRPE